MDLVDWSEARFRAIEAELRTLAARVEVPAATAIPLSALTGANVAERGAELSWYAGPSLLTHLETVPIAHGSDLTDVRFPVQWVIRPQTDAHHDYRGYAGTLASGVLRAGAEVIALPSGRATRVTRIEQGGRPIESATAAMSVIVHLADDVDVSRGDLLCRPGHRPAVGQDLEATICWMAERPLTPGARYALKHTTRWVRAIVSELCDRLDVQTGERAPAPTALGLNDLGRIRIRTTAPVIYDPYADNRTTGSFILVDESSNATVAAGMLLAAPSGAAEAHG
jgi:sulfate adenylyltransferase subunit 1 (EFTu-like GTPase family)